MAPDARSGFNQQVYEEACEWFVECRSGDLDQHARRELDRWLRKSPEHLSAYLEITAIWNEGPQLDAQHEWDSARLVKEAREEPDNVVLLSEQRETPTSKGAGVTRRGLALAASLAVFCAGALSWYVAIRAPTYSTDVGEQRSIVLADGSTVDLNALSRVKIRYSEQERAVDLIEGQALFRVAKDAQRPFIVTSGRTRVRAVGTQFDVYKKRSGTIVTVVEGRVAILTSPAAPGLGPVLGDSEQGKATSAARVASPGAMLLSAGEQATVTPEAARKVDRPNVASATAWTQRQLVFDSASLAEVVEEFNRYNPRPLVIERADLYDFHISGVFSSTDPASLVSFLRQRFDVEVVETPAEIRVTEKVR